MNVCVTTVRRFLFAAEFGFLCFIVAYAQGTGMPDFTKKVVFAERTAVQPVIDGKSDEAVWKQAARLDEFMLLKKTPDALSIPAREQTTGYVLRDDENLYFFARCSESRMPGIKTDKRERDSQVYLDDCVEIFLRPERGGKVYQIAVNSIGTISDLVYSGKKPDSSWNSKGKVAARRADTYWEVELAIPLASFSKEEQESAEWGFNLCREEKRLNENSGWSTPIVSFSNQEAFGMLVLESRSVYLNKIIGGLKESARPVDVSSVPQKKLLDKTRANIQLLERDVEKIAWDALYPRADGIRKKLELFAQGAVTSANLNEWMQCFPKDPECRELVIAELKSRAHAIPALDSPEKELLEKTRADIRLLEKDTLADDKWVLHADGIFKKLELFAEGPITYENLEAWDKVFPGPEMTRRRASYSELFRYAFDFGTRTSPLKDMFKRITKETGYSPDPGYGWQDTLSVHDGYSVDHDKHGITWSSDLSADWNWGETGNSFIVDLPNGDYTLWLLAGFNAPAGQIWADYFVQTGEGSQHWIGAPGSYFLADMIGNTTVKDGRLEIKFQPQLDWVISALVICPAGRARELKEIAGYFLSEIKFPAKARETWKEVKVEERQPAPVLSSGEVDKGYQLFARHWADNVYPNTVPRKEELNRGITLFASLGEYEPAAFSLYPVRNLEDVKLEVSPLLNSRQRRIPTENIDVRVVRYSYSARILDWRIADDESYDKGKFRLMPDILEPFDSLDIKTGQTTTFWITVKVPEDAEAGDYAGTITVSVNDAHKTTLPMRLNVLPIRLESDPARYFGMYYRESGAWSDVGRNDKIRKRMRDVVEAEFTDMKNHGMNTICFPPFPSPVQLFKARGDEVEFYPEGLRFIHHCFELSIRAGFTGPVTFSLQKEGPVALYAKRSMYRAPEIAYRQLVNEVRLLRKAQQENGWPELLFYPVDEPSAANKLRGEAVVIEDLIHLLKCVKEGGGKSYVTVVDYSSGPYQRIAEAIEPYLNVACLGAMRLTPEEIARKRAKYPELSFWCYPNDISGSADRGIANYTRMFYGFKFWTSGFDALVPYGYNVWVCNPRNDLDGSLVDYYFVCPGPDGRPLPSTKWEAIREGIDDGRYIYTLEKLIAQARGETALEAEIGEAEALLEEIREKTKPVDIVRPYADMLKGYWPGAEYDAYRFSLAQNILSLSRSLATIRRKSGKRQEGSPEPVAWWAFEKGTNACIAYDKSGHGNDGMVYGGVWVEGKFGRALSLNGSGEYVDCGNPASLNFDRQDFSIEAWVKAADLAGEGIHPIISKRKGQQRQVSLVVRGEKAANPCRVHFETGGGVDADAGPVSKVQLKTGAWYHIVAVYRDDADNPTAKIYINGAESGNGSAGRIGKGGPAWEIGRKQDTSFKGIIGGIRIYNRALPADEVAKHYTRESPNYTTP